MTIFAKKICKTAHNTLQVHCGEIVAGNITMLSMRNLKENETRVDQLCTAARIKDFNLQKWLGRLENVEKYVVRVQKFHNLLDKPVQG